MAEIRLYLVFNLTEQYEPRMLSLETDQGSVVPVFTTSEAAQWFLNRPLVQRLIVQGDGPKGILEQTATSFEAWLSGLRTVDRSTEKITFVLDTDPTWRDLSTQLG